MLAVEGPIATSRAPCGRFTSIQRPISRPAGRPPEPARNVVVGTGLTASQLGTTRLTTAAATTPTRTHRDAAGRTAGRGGIGTRITARAASSTTAGAVTSRYWYPL